MSKRTLLLIFLVGVIAYFAVAFTNRAMDNYQVKKSAEETRQEVAALEKENNQLRQSLNYYNSDAFVEKEAREKLNMVKPGEHQVIVTGAPTPTADPSTAPSTQAMAQRQPVYNWQRWWEYFTRDR